MTKQKQQLTMSQGQTIGQAHNRFLGAAIGLLLVFCIPVFVLVTAGMVRAQGQNGVSEPQPGELISGVISIRGTAQHDSFLRYELAFDNGAGWLVFAEGDEPVVNGTLAIWDTTIGQPQNPVFPDGTYQLRLRVVREDYNYDEYFVRDLTIMNQGTATATATMTATAEATLPPGTVATGETPTSGFTILQPTPLPSLTPFASPTFAGLAPEGSDPRGVADRPGGGLEEEGRLSRLLGTNVKRFGNAFWVGVAVAVLVFGLLALYLLLRALARYTWRLFQGRRYRNSRWE